ncbi:MAG: hypothetical protein OEM63_14680 [Gammaproteobacteria bacterium]|nr:hypothetical protein [Gammaproteobacteria bacterium]
MSLLGDLKQRNVLRVGAAYLAVAWLAVQIVETVFPVFGFRDAAVRVVVIVLGIGLVPALVLAWVFELSPEGVKRDVDVDHASPGSVSSAKRLDRLIMFALALALGYFALDKFLLDPARDLERERAVAEAVRQETLAGTGSSASIVVLPFANTSDDASNEYFSDGITEEILNRLARVRGLKVISRTSAFSYKGRDIDIPTVAGELDIAHVLEGSVRKDGDYIRVAVQLIDARTDTQLWSRTFNRTLEDVFAIQEEIATEIVGELELEIADVQRPRSNISPNDYALFLRARHITTQAGNVSVQQRDEAERLLRQALEESPDFAPALYELARVNWQRRWIEGSTSLEEYRQLNTGYLARILDIDPDYAPAHYGLALSAAESENDLVATAGHLQRALELDPASEDVLWGGIDLLIALGRVELAIDLTEIGVNRNPLFPGIYYRRIMAYYHAGRFGEADTAAQQFALLFEEPFAFVGTINLMQGDFQAALSAFEQLDDTDPARIAGSVMALHSLGQHEKRDSMLMTLEKDAAVVRPSEFAFVYAWIGEADAAFAWLERFFDPHVFRAGETWTPDVSSISLTLHDPLFWTLRDDPRWQPLLESKGVSSRQLAQIEFDIVVPTGL